MKPRRGAARFASALALLVTVGGCATILGIDDDYGMAEDTPDGSSVETSGPATGGPAAGVGGRTNSSSTTGMAGGGGTANAGGGRGIAGGGGEDAGIAGGSVVDRDAADANTIDRSAGGAGGAGGTGAGGNASAGTGGSAGAGGKAEAGGKAGAGGGVDAGDGGRVLSPILRVQRGSTTLAMAAASQKVTLAQVDLTKALLVFGARFDATGPADTQVSGQITGATEVTFARNGTTGAMALPVQYYVAEFQSGVQIQRGATTMTATSMIVTLPLAADLTKSFPVVSYRNDGATYGRDDYVRAKLTSATQLQLENTLAAPNGVVEWQVVTFDGARVQSGDIAIADADTQLTATVPTVDPAKTWVITSYDFSAFNGGASQLMFRGKVESATQLGFRRHLGGAAGALTWYAVSFTNGTNVQTGSTNVPELTTTATAPLTAVDPLKTIAVSGGLYGRGGITASAVSSPGLATFTLDVGTGSQLAIGRGVALPASAASVDWSAINFF